MRVARNARNGRDTAKRMHRFTERQADGLQGCGPRVRGSCGICAQFRMATGVLCVLGSILLVLSALKFVVAVHAVFCTLALGGYTCVRWQAVLLSNAPIFETCCT